MDDDDEDIESSYSETENEDIQRRKSKQSLNGINSKHIKQPNLLRDNTNSPWNNDDIDMLQNDMEKQLISLTKRASQRNENLSLNESKNHRVIVGDISDDDD